MYKLWTLFNSKMVNIPKKLGILNLLYVQKIICLSICILFWLFGTKLNVRFRWKANKSSNAYIIIWHKSVKKHEFLHRNNNFINVESRKPLGFFALNSGGVLRFLWTDVRLPRIGFLRDWFQYSYRLNQS